MIKVTELLLSLGDMLGIAMLPEENGACRVLFGETAVDFQVADNHLFLRVQKAARRSFQRC